MYKNFFILTLLIITSATTQCMQLAQSTTKSPEPAVPETQEDLAFIAELKVRAIKICAYLSAAEKEIKPEGGMKPSLEKALDLCELSLSHSRQELVIQKFNRWGLYNPLKEVADSGNSRACYVVCCLLENKNEESKQEFLRNYLSFACASAPLAYGWAIELETDFEMLTQLCGSAEKKLSQIHPFEKAALIRQITKRLYALWKEEKSEKHSVLSLLLRWQIKNPDADESFNDISNSTVEKKEDMADFESLLIGYDQVKKCVAHDSVAAYCAGCLFWKGSLKAETEKKAKSLKAKALQLWNKAYKGDYLPALWKRLELHKQFEEYANGNLETKFLEVLSKSRSTKISSSDTVLATAARHAVAVLEKSAKSFEEKCALGEFYRLGIPEIIAKNEEKALIWYKLAYHEAFSASEKKKSATIARLCTDNLTNLSASDAPDASFKRKALIRTLCDRLQRDDWYHALVALIRMHAFGLHGIRADTQELINVCRHCYVVFGTHTAQQDISKFFEKTELISLLETGAHRKVHCFIVGLIFAASDKKMTDEAYRKCTQIIEKFESETAHETAEVRALSAATIFWGLQYALTHKDLLAVLFFADLALKHFKAVGYSDTEVVPRSATLAALEGVCALLSRNSRPFFTSEVYCKRVISYIQEMKAPQIAGQFEQSFLHVIKRTSGVLRLMVDSDYFTDGFFEGLHILKDLATVDPYSKKVLKQFYERIRVFRLLSPTETDPVPLIRYKLALAAVALHDHDALLQGIAHFKECLQYIVKEWDTRYVQFCTVHQAGLNRLENMVHELASHPEHVDFSVRSKICLTLHYRMLAEMLDEVEEKTRLQNKANTLYTESFSVNTFLTNLCLVEEYLDGTLVDKNPHKYKEYWIPAAEYAKTNVLSKVENKRFVAVANKLCEMLTDSTLPEDTSFLDEVRQAGLIRVLLGE